MEDALRKKSVGALLDVGMLSSIRHIECCCEGRVPACRLKYLQRFVFVQRPKQRKGACGVTFPKVYNKMLQRGVYFMCAHKTDQSPNGRKLTAEFENDESESTASLDKENERLQQEVWL